MTAPVFLNFQGKALAHRATHSNEAASHRRLLSAPADQVSFGAQGQSEKLLQQLATEEVQARIPDKVLEGCLSGFHRYI